MSDADCASRIAAALPFTTAATAPPTCTSGWESDRLLNKKGKAETIPTLYAKCHSQDCDGPVVLRFLARESGFRWPIASGVRWGAQPMDALADTLSPVCGWTFA